ncbi:MAG: CRISPR-associated endonuclease Cas3'' [Schwartzia succinivorans]|nr:CRISPR-associated endonuclease Cas3'' [Schwartzia succinivorans]
MKEYLAHSARDGRLSQSYKDHVNNVRKAAKWNAEKAARFSKFAGSLLIHVVDTAACIHDLGKLLDENQEVLHGTDNRGTLPVNHVDAGVACLRKCKGDSFFSQTAVYSHHRGLPDFPEEENREDDFFRDNDPKVRHMVNAQIDSLTRIHCQLIPDAEPHPQETDLRGDSGVFFRMMLSCLADADHSDTARHYGKYPAEEKVPDLRAEERLHQLDAYIQSFSQTNERNRLRADMYQACREADVSSDIVACDSPVGSGKTTAVMAHLLAQAIRRGSRRIFVILPFTNIIRQSVETYRKTLVLPGENEEEVVAELHYRADFEDVDVRALTAQWRAPIIVTTAVAFFETLASNRPAALRRLHELPGSLFFMDEAHAALPMKMLPLAWRWMQVLADEWSCYWVLASGSLVRFWELKAEDWKKKSRDVSQILSEDMRKRLMGFEKARISFCYEPKPLNRKELVERIISEPGPRLLIMNTVQSAAVMATDLQKYYGEFAANKVMHLSTALNAEDRDKIVADVKTRLNNNADNDWTLVATSCVEAGVDFSFKTGFREMASLLSLLQAAGRVNRGGSDNDARIWSFVMQDDSLLKINPGVKTAAQILKKYFDRGIEIHPDLSTEFMQKELNLTADDMKILLQAEADCRFPLVREKFRVIDDDTVLVVADRHLKADISKGVYDWRALQRKAVSIRRYYVQKYELQPLADGLYDWNRGYDEFLGIMRGIINDDIMKEGVLLY